MTIKNIYSNGSRNVNGTPLFSKMPEIIKKLTPDVAKKFPCNKRKQPQSRLSAGSAKEI